MAITFSVIKQDLEGRELMYRINWRFGVIRVYIWNLEGDSSIIYVPESTNWFCLISPYIMKVACEVIRVYPNSPTEETWGTSGIIYIPE